LKKLLEKGNFEVINVDHFNNWWHPPTIVITLFPNLAPQKAWQEEEKSDNPVLKRLFWIFWTQVLAPFAFFESLAKKTAIFTIYAKRFN
jgi:hypothetical protein